MKLAKALLASLLAAAALTAQADTITPVTADSNWNQFYYGDASTPWLDLSAFDSSAAPVSFTITLQSAAQLNVTAAGYAGDVFQVFDNASSLGSTSTPTGTNTDYADLNFDQAFSSNKWSHGSWTLSAGTHTITGLVTISALQAGAGAIQVIAVPEPTSYAMLMAGLGLIGLIARRRA